MRMASLGRQKQCLTFLSQSPQQTKVPFYQSVSWRTNELIVLTKLGGMWVSSRIMGPKVATVKGLHASWMMASPWLSSQPICSSLKPHGGKNGWHLSGGTLTLTTPPSRRECWHPQTQPWWSQPQAISWRWRLLGEPLSLPQCITTDCFRGNGSKQGA